MPEPIGSLRILDISLSYCFYWWQKSSSYAQEIEAPRKKRIKQLEMFYAAGFNYDDLGTEAADKWIAEGWY